MNLSEFRAISLVFVGIALLSGCSSSRDASRASDAVAPSEAGSAADEVVSCQTDPRVSSTALPLTLSGPGGYRVTLSDRAPNPSAKGLNQWTIAVTDAMGAPLAGANLVLETSMPDHGHSSTPPVAPTTDARGTSVVPDLDFFMAGVWRTQVDVYPADATAGADPTDSVAFLFCIEG